MCFGLEIVEGINFMVSNEIYRKSAVQQLTVRPSIRPSNHSVIYPSTNCSICTNLFTYLSVCLSVSLCLSISVSVCLSVCLSIYLSYLSIYLCLSACLSIYLSICLSVYLSIYLPACLPACLLCLSKYLLLQTLLIVHYGLNLEHS